LEQQLCDIDARSTDDLSDEDYAGHSDASSNPIEKRPPSKRLRQAKDPSNTAYHDLEKDSAYSFDLLNQDVATNLSTATP
jgi:hypothetical protein